MRKQPISQKKIDTIEPSGIIVETGKMPTLEQYRARFVELAAGYQNRGEIAEILTEQDPVTFPAFHAVSRVRNVARGKAKFDTTIKAVLILEQVIKKQPPVGVRLKRQNLVIRK